MYGKKRIGHSFLTIFVTFTTKETYSKNQLHGQQSSTHEEKAPLVKVSHTSNGLPFLEISKSLSVARAFFAKKILDFGIIELTVFHFQFV